MAATENPAFAGGPEGAAAGSSVDIEAGLRDGTLTAEQAVVLQERQLKRQEEKMEAMRAEMRAEIAAAQLGIAEGGATLAAAVRSVVMARAGRRGHGRGARAAPGRARRARARRPPRRRGAGGAGGGPGRRRRGPGS